MEEECVAHRSIPQQFVEGAAVKATTGGLSDYSRNFHNRMAARTGRLIVLLFHVLSGRGDVPAGLATN